MINHGMLVSSPCCDMNTVSEPIFPSIINTNCLNLRNSLALYQSIVHLLLPTYFNHPSNSSYGTLRRLSVTVLFWSSSFNSHCVVIQRVHRIREKQLLPRRRHQDANIKKFPLNANLISSNHFPESRALAKRVSAVSKFLLFPDVSPDLRSDSIRTSSVTAPFPIIHLGLSLASPTYRLLNSLAHCNSVLRMAGLPPLILL